MSVFLFLLTFSFGLCVGFIICAILLDVSRVRHAARSATDAPDLFDTRYFAHVCRSAAAQRAPIAAEVAERFEVSESQASKGREGPTAVLRWVRGLTPLS